MAVKVFGLRSSVPKLSVSAVERRASIRSISFPGLVVPLNASALNAVDIAIIRWLSIPGLVEICSGTLGGRYGHLGIQVSGGWLVGGFGVSVEMVGCEIESEKIDAL